MVLEIVPNKDLLHLNWLVSMCEIVIQASRNSSNSDHARYNYKI